MKDTVDIKYFNEKELGFCDFIEEIKEDFLKNISKNRGLLFEGKCIAFDVYYFNKHKDGYETIYYYCDINFGVKEICVDKFCKGILNCANEHYIDLFGNYVGNEENYIELQRDNENWEFYDYIRNFSGYYDKECNINRFDNNFIIEIVNIRLQMDTYKLLHKEKFYKSLYDELMAIAWHPSRYLDWCIDFEELRDLKERWGKED